MCLHIYRFKQHLSTRSCFTHLQYFLSALVSTYACHVVYFLSSSYLCPSTIWKECFANQTWNKTVQILFLGAFAILRKATLSFGVSVCIEQLGSPWTDFDEILYLGIFSKICWEKIQVSLKSENNNKHFAWRSMNIYSAILLNSA